jgi:predicted porin
MMFRRLITVSLLIASPLAGADALDISLNNNAAAFGFNTSAGALVQGNSEFHIGLTYNDSMNTLIEGGMLVRGDEGEATGASLAVGAKALVGMIKNYIPGTTQNVGAIAIGGEFGFVAPAAKQLSAGIYYFGGPKITTFGDANRASQWGLHADYEVAPGTKVYIEYRQTDFGITATGQTATVDSGTYLGMKLAF